jgi:hypothetical protein
MGHGVAFLLGRINKIPTFRFACKAWSILEGSSWLPATACIEFSSKLLFAACSLAAKQPIRGNGREVLFRRNASGIATRRRHSEIQVSKIRK